MSAPLMPADRWGERLTRRLGLWSAVAVLVGSTIGSGIFRTPAGVARLVDDVPLFLLAWVVGAAVVFCGALAVLIVAGLLLGGATAATVPDMMAQRAHVGLSPFLLAMVAILWAYDGWGDLAFVGGEVKDPQRNLPRAMFIGTGSVVALYLAANLVYLRLIPIQQMKGAELVAADVARVLLGGAGLVAVSAAVAVSTFGTLNGSMMTAPRIFFAMAEDRVFPRAITRVDPRTGAPTGAIVLAGCLGAVFVLVRKFTELADQFIIGIWPFYALAVAAVFVLRRRLPATERRYRTWGYPVVPALFLLGALFVLGNYLVSEPLLFWLDVGVILLGIPVYVVWRRYAAPPTPDLTLTRR